ncbi:MAG: DUF3108 domain-containing protein [Bacteroidales bacterium]|nr:DUF3108 domain-containing protein [Bacteroidales bacterium]
MNIKTNSCRIFVFSVLCLISSHFVEAQKITNTAFQGGEKLRYTGSYYMSSVWTDIAEVTLEVSSVNSQGTALLNLKGTAKTFASWDTYFKIRDSYQSWVTPVTVEPLIFKRDMYEGGYTNDSKYVFKRKSKVAVCKTKRKDGSESVDEVSIKDNTLDVVSVLYYVRNLNFEQMALNKVVPLTILIDNKLETIYIKYLGTETIKADILGSTKCHKLGVSLKNENIMKNKSTNNIWLTADKNKIPVYMKAEIPVGSIQLRLTEASGLKN